MRRSKLDVVLSLRRRRSLQALLALALLYLVLVCFLEFPFLASRMSASVGFIGGGDALSRVRHLDSEEATEVRSAPARPSKGTSRLPQSSSGSRPPSDLQQRRRSLIISGLNFVETNATLGGPLHRSARDAWEVGSKLLHELKSALLLAPPQSPKENRTDDNCPDSIMLTGAQFRERRRVMVLPCGLTLGSHITLAAKPHPANPMYSSKVAKLKEREKATTMESQFRMELLGLNAVDGEEPPRILHFNPRLKGDWSRKPVIEHNTCYRMQWGVAQRCEGWKSEDNEETVDGLVKCEKWIRDDDDGLAESTTTWWLNRLIGRIKKPPINWPYPFVEDRLFVLTLSAGLEGYHANVNGRHVTSFPYRTGFVLEDATGLSLNGDLDIQSIVAGSLPTSHSSFALQSHLEWSTEWQALPLAEGPVELFIGILSGGSHFAERMAVRKSWMIAIRKSSNVVARFFVALNGRRELNMILKKEAEFFGDIVIVPFMDSYDLVVLKTIAICEYGVRAVSAKYIMKCDDDTFVRIEAVMNAVKKIPSGKSLYMGNINYYHQPLREGKWAVTYETWVSPPWRGHETKENCKNRYVGSEKEEWPGEVYPPYANGAGYVVSSDIARFVVSESEKKMLRLFKMEDVSMGMWVEKFNTRRPVEYVDDYHFCQFGCMDGYYTAHYQSPRLMMCMWKKLQMGKPECCATR